MCVCILSSIVLSKKVRRCYKKQNTDIFTNKITYETGNKFLFWVEQIVKSNKIRVLSATEHSK